MEAGIGLLKQLDHSLDLVAPQHEVRGVVQLELVAQALLAPLFRQEGEGDLRTPCESGVG